MKNKIEQIVRIKIFVNKRNVCMYQNYFYYNKRYVWNYSPLPDGDFIKDLQPAPRYSMAAYIFNQCGKNGQLLQQRLNEYDALYQEKPPQTWWGWQFFIGKNTNHNSINNCCTTYISEQTTYTSLRVQHPTLYYYCFTIPHVHVYIFSYTRVVYLKVGQR